MSLKPGLKSIEERKLHIELKEVLEAENYSKYVSIEIGKVENISILKEKMRYVSNIFQ